MQCNANPGANISVVWVLVKKKKKVLLRFWRCLDFQDFPAHHRWKCNSTKKHRQRGRNQIWTQHCRACVDNSFSYLKNISSDGCVAFRAQASTCNTSTLTGQHSFLTSASVWLTVEESCQFDGLKMISSVSNMLPLELQGLSQFHLFIFVFNTFLETKGERRKMDVIPLTGSNGVGQWGFVALDGCCSSVTCFDMRDNVFERKEERKRDERVTFNVSSSLGLSDAALHFLVFRFSLVLLTNEAVTTDCRCHECSKLEH